MNKVDRLLYDLEFARGWPEHLPNNDNSDASIIKIIPMSFDRARGSHDSWRFNVSDMTDPNANCYLLVFFSRRNDFGTHVILVDKDHKWWPVQTFDTTWMGDNLECIGIWIKVRCNFETTNGLPTVKMVSEFLNV